MGINLQDGFRELRKHIGHVIEVVLYQGQVSVTIECETCNEILLEFEQPKVVLTPEGNQFERQEDGSWQCGEGPGAIIYPNLDKLGEYVDFTVLTEDETSWCEPCQSYHSPKAPGCVARKKRRR
jgi:hypothetical protein